MKYEPQIISVNRGFSFAHVSLLGYPVKCFDNFQTILYDQLKKNSWISCLQTSAVGHAGENWMNVFFPIDENGGENVQYFN